MLKVKSEQQKQVLVAKLEQLEKQELLLNMELDSLDVVKSSRQHKAV